MKTLKNFILEAKAPVFTDDIEGIKAFCEYASDPEFEEWTVNPDKTITVKLKNPRNYNVYINTGDLKEIPDFIVFTEMPEYNLFLSRESKIDRWAPKVNGAVAGIGLSENKKTKVIDLSGCDMKGGKLWIDKSFVERIENAKGENIQIFIRRNRRLNYIDIGNIKNLKENSSWLTHNRSLDPKEFKLPKGIAVEKNKENEKIYIS